MCVCVCTSFLSVEKKVGARVFGEYFVVDIVVVLLALSLGLNANI